MAFYKCGRPKDEPKILAMYLASWYSNGTQRSSYIRAFSNDVTIASGGNGSLTSTITFNKPKTIDVYGLIQGRGNIDARYVRITRGSEVVYQNQVNTENPSINLFPLTVQYGETLTVTSTQVSSSNNCASTILFYEIEAPTPIM